MSQTEEPTIEIFSFTASEDFVKDETLTHPAFELIRTWKGLRHIYEGKCIDTEETNKRFLFLVWDAYEDHKSLIDDKVYPEVQTALGKCIGGDPSMFHVVFSDNTRIALTSPITEVVQQELKDKNDPEKKTALNKVMSNYIDRAHRVAPADEHQPFVFGETRESAGTFFFLGGWTSKDHHLNTVMDPAKLKSEVDQIGAYATYKIHHVIVREYGLGRD